MDGRILAESLMELSGTRLRELAGLFLKLDLRRHLLPNLKGTETGEELLAEIQTAAEKLKDQSDAALQVELFIEITKILKLTGLKYDRQEAVEEQCGEIVEGVYEELRKTDADFKAFTDTPPVPGRIHQLLYYLLQRLFEDIGQLPAGEVKEMAERLAVALESLSADKQEAVRQAFGLETLTEKDITLILSGDGTDALFKTVAETGGYAFIRIAQAMLQEGTGRAMVLTHLPALAGKSNFLAVPQNRTLKKRLLPAIILLVVLPSMSSETEHAFSFKPFIAEWNRRYGQFMAVCGKLTEVKEQIREFEEAIAANEQHQHELTDEMELMRELSYYEKQKVRIDLMNRKLDRLPYISDTFEELKTAYEKMKQTASQIQGKEEVVPKSFRGRISTAILNFSAAHEIRELNKEADATLDRMAEEVLRSDSLYKTKERDNVRKYSKTLEELEARLHEAEKERDQIGDELQEAKFAYQDRLLKVKKSAKEMYGLEDLFEE